MKFNKGVLYILIGASFFGFTPIFAKIGFSQGYSLGQINIVQMILSFILLWSLTLIKRASFKGLHRKNILQVMVTGCFIGLTSIFYYGSMQYLPASLAIILMFQFVWIGIILEWIFSKIKPSKLTVLSILLILVGVFFASNFVNGDINGLPLKGFVFGILSAFTYAGFIFCSGKVAVNVDPWTRSSLMVTGSTILVLVVFMADIPAVLPLEKDLLTTAVGVSLFGAVLPPLFFAAGAPLVSGGMANILTSIELPIAILSASLILSEAVSPFQWFGIVIILAAIALNELSPNLFRIKKFF
ncbi:multidrug DMT transporter permease [Planococcus glaciei]|uniref:DMT family transporter n=1 Tax=Planococcus glaciei TaxID=459472 RepID=A0A7H8Q8I8_9BACL|nr:DMT family transporter [Planococcus glaciei]KOF09754.1 multidrug DMT transporter permease [Planococcus glaciei]QDY45329.1 DMT family transporter [Planococcus glaciei]QKX50304.1 DMT family transporter [Planococcus glaciei]